MNTANTDYPKPFFKPIEYNLLARIGRKVRFLRRTHERFYVEEWIKKCPPDDFMFGCIMENEHICRGVLERLLRMKIGKIEYPTLQKSISPFYESKGIRLDVYT